MVTVQAVLLEDEPIGRIEVDVPLRFAANGDVNVVQRQHVGSYASDRHRPGGPTPGRARRRFGRRLAPRIGQHQQQASARR